MTFRHALIALMTMTLLACGGGDGESGFAIASDLTLTARIDSPDAPGAAVTIGPEGGSLTINSGQRLEISSSTPVVYSAGSGSAISNTRLVTPLVWDAVITSPVDTSFTLTATSAVDSGQKVTLAINVLARL